MSEIRETSELEKNDCVRRLLIVTATCMGLVSSTADAAENSSETIRLRCAYSYSIHSDGSRGGTSGEDLFTVKYTNDGKAKIRKQGLGAEFSGNISDEEIVGDAIYQVANVRMIESLVINRFTGAFQISFVAVGKSGLIHFGTCRPVTKPLF